MSGKDGLKVSIGGMVLYLIIAFVFFLSKDKVHTLMFLAGAILWIFSIFIWNRNAEHEDRDNE